MIRVGDINLYKTNQITYQKTEWIIVRKFIADVGHIYKFIWIFIYN